MPSKLKNRYVTVGKPTALRKVVWLFPGAGSNIMARTESDAKQNQKDAVDIHCDAILPRNAPAGRRQSPTALRQSSQGAQRRRRVRSAPESSADPGMRNQQNMARVKRK
jgi:hypothetical protein